MSAERGRSHKKMDPDVKALRTCVRALLASSSERMLVANMEYLWDRFIIRRPPASDVIGRKSA